VRRGAALLAALLVLPAAAPAEAAESRLTAKPAATAGTAAKRKPRPCVARARTKPRERRCRLARLGLRVAPRVFDRLVDRGAGPAPPRTGPPAPGPGTPGSPSAPGGPPPAQPLADYVAVTASEWRLALSRPLVGAGLVTVELRNAGEDPHDLVVAPEGGGAPAHHFPETDPGVYTAAGMQLAAGRYTLFCSLPGHAEAGMTAALQVAQP
jgi:Sulfocyanin (SoxE) domain